MVNFPYISGGSKQTFTFSDNGYFRYPKKVTITANVSTINGAVQAFNQHTELESVDFEDNSDLSTIGYNAFQGCTGLKSVIFPSGKTLTLNGYAFGGCSNLETVSFPECTVNIGNAPFAFQGCTKLSQTSFEALMKQVTGTIIPGQMFANCQAIVSLTVPDTVTQLVTSAFAGCTDLSAVNLNNVTTLQANVFSGCTAITEIDLNNVVSLYASIFIGCTALKKVTFRKMPTSGTGNLAVVSTNHVFYNCTAIEDVVLPDGWDINLLLSNGTSNFTNVLTHDSMVAMIDALYDFSGGTSHTLTLGATNLARLSAEEQAVAAAKNWTLS